MTERERLINELVEYIEATLAVCSEYVNVPLDLLQYAVAFLKEQENLEEQCKINADLCCGLMSKLMDIRNGDNGERKGEE